MTPRPVAPRIGFPETMLAEEQEEYLTVCVAEVEYADGSIGIMTRWKLDEEEKAKIAAGEDIYLSLITFGQPMQPIQMIIGRPDWAREEETP